MPDPAPSPAPRSTSSPSCRDAGPRPVTLILAAIWVVLLIGTPLYASQQMTGLFGIWLVTLGLCVALTWRRTPRDASADGVGLPAGVAVGAALALLGLVGASTFWSIEPNFSAQRFGKLFGFAVSAVLAWLFLRRLDPRLSAAERRILEGALVLVSAAIGLGVVGIDIGLLPADPFGTRALTEMEIDNAAVRPSSIGALLVWPALAVLARRGAWPWAIALFALAAAGSLVGPSMVAALGLALGALMAAGMAWRPKATAVVGGLLIAAYLLGAPTVMRAPAVGDALLSAIPSSAFSAKHRVLIWHFTANRGAEAPWLGHGLGSSRFISGGSRNIDPTDPVFPSEWLIYFDHNRIRHGEPLPLHPHNLALQVNLELGRVGAALLTVVFAGLLLAIARRREPIERALWGGFGVGWLVIASLSYGAWQSWWISTLAIATLFLYQTAIRPTEAPSSDGAAGAGPGRQA